MISSLASVLGVSAQDPSFWMPLALMGLLFAIIVAGTVLGGFDIGVGWLTPFAPPQTRARMISLLRPRRHPYGFLPFSGNGLVAAGFSGKSEVGSLGEDGCSAWWSSWGAEHLTKK